MSRASTVTPMQRSSLSLEHLLPARHRTFTAKRDSLCMESQAVARYAHARCVMQQVSLACAPVSRYSGSITLSMCICTLTAPTTVLLHESWSQPSQAVKARSAVLAASAQLQGSTEARNVKRAAAHCHLVVVGGHVDSSTSGWRQRPKDAKQRFCRLVLDGHPMPMHRFL